MMINIDSNNLSYIDWAIGLFGIIITTIIAYHIHALSKKVSFRARLKHQKIIKNYISELKTEIHYKGRNCKVIIIDIDVYDKYYPQNFNKFNRHSHVAGELKDATFDGIEIIDGIMGVSNNDNESLFHIEQNQPKQKAVSVGVIPYDWIIDINLDGDGINSSAIIYCRFRNKTAWRFRKDLKINSKTGEFYEPKIWHLSREWSPYKIHRYYLLNLNYNKDRNYYWEQYMYPIKISKR